MADYRYHKALLHELAKPGTAGTPAGLDDVTLQHVATQGRKESAAQKLASDVDYMETARTERGRQFNTRLAADRKMLDTWADQNRWATAIALGNLGISALSIPADMRTAEKAEALTLKQIATWDTIRDLYKKRNTLTP